MAGPISQPSHDHTLNIFFDALSQAPDDDGFFPVQSVVFTDGLPAAGQPFPEESDPFLRLKAIHRDERLFIQFVDTSGTLPDGTMALVLTSTNTGLNPDAPTLSAPANAVFQSQRAVIDGFPVVIDWKFQTSLLLSVDKQAKEYRTAELSSFKLVPTGDVSDREVGNTADN